MLRREPAWFAWPGAYLRPPFCVRSGACALRERRKMDVLCVVMAIGFFGAAALYVRGCEKL